MTETYSRADSKAAGQGAGRQGKPEGNGAARCFVLFDYRRRNPLTYEAAVQTVDLT